MSQKPDKVQAIAYFNKGECVGILRGDQEQQLFGVKFDNYAIGEAGNFQDAIHDAFAAYAQQSNLLRDDIPNYDNEPNRRFREREAARRGNSSPELG